MHFYYIPIQLKLEHCNATFWISYSSSSNTLRHVEEKLTGNYEKNGNDVIETLTLDPTSPMSKGPSYWGKQQFSENWMNFTGSLLTNRHTDT